MERGFDKAGQLVHGDQAPGQGDNWGKEDSSEVHGWEEGDADVMEDGEGCGDQETPKKRELAVLETTGDMNEYGG